MKLKFWIRSKFFILSGTQYLLVPNLLLSLSLSLRSLGRGRGGGRGVLSEGRCAVPITVCSSIFVEFWSYFVACVCVYKCVYRRLLGRGFWVCYRLIIFSILFLRLWVQLVAGFLHIVLLGLEVFRYVVLFLLWLFMMLRQMGASILAHYLFDGFSEWLN